LLALLLGALALGGPARADAACEAEYCTTAMTEPDGRYQLDIAPHLVGFFYPTLAGCTWDVEAQYGDGSAPGEYVFSEAEGLEADHTYPEPGVYTFHAYATNGVHDGTSEECPALHIEATVIYPEPTPPKEPEEPGPEEPVKQPTAGSGGGAPPMAATPAAPMPPSPAVDRFWRECGGGVLAHRVPRSKARRVIRAARSLLASARSPERLAEGAIFKAAGFTCRLRKGDAGSVSCWRGRQRVSGT
jgi:hypothetical protein